MFNIYDAVDIANKLNIKFDKFSVQDFLTGLNIELEHGNINTSTNVTNNNLKMTAKIALAHLNEFSNYYNKEYGLPYFEKILAKTNIFIILKLLFLTSLIFLFYQSPMI